MKRPVRPETRGGAAIYLTVLAIWAVPVLLMLLTVEVAELIAYALEACFGGW